MTISKAYSLLEAEGILARQRGKLMTVAADAGQGESKGSRLERLGELIAPLATAARQLELKTDDVLDAVREALETNDD